LSDGGAPQPVVATEFSRIYQGILKDIRLSPRPEDLRDAVAQVSANPTEFLRSYQWEDTAELGALLAAQIDRALQRRADKEARELVTSMGAKA
jgi:hypothetical protein